MTVLWIIVLAGALAIAFAAWATRSVLSADAGSARMQEISAAVREGAQAYLKRQYTTIGLVGIVIFLIVVKSAAGQVNNCIFWIDANTLVVVSEGLI